MDLGKLTGGRAAKFFLLSLIGSVVGAFTASFISYFLYPWRQPSFLMFLRDLLSTGAFVSALFVWLIHVPALILLFYLHKRFSALGRSNWFALMFLAASFVLIFIAQIGPFATVAHASLEYLLNTLVVGILLLATMALTRGKDNSKV